MLSINVIFAPLYKQRLNTNSTLRLNTFTFSNIRLFDDKNSLDVLKNFFTLKSNSAVNKELIRIGKLAKIEKHFSFHSARHTNATLLMEKGANITTVQKLLGHRSISTTQIYSQILESTLVNDLKKCSQTKCK